MVVAANNNKVRSEQVKLLFDANLASILATIILALVLVFILWDSSLPHDQLTVWLTAILIINFGRAILYLSVNKKVSTDNQGILLYERYFTVSTLLSAGAWAVLPIFLYPDAITFQTVIAFVLAGLCAGAVTALSFRLTVIIPYLVICLLPLIVRLFSSADYILNAMGFMVALFMLILIMTAKRIYSNTEQNIVLLLNSDKREQELENNIIALQNFHSITANPDISFDNKLQQLLGLGLTTFNLDIGIISHIVHSVYTIDHIRGPEGAPEPGTKFDFNETYCANTFLGNTPRGFHHVAKSEIASHPCYEAFKLEAYIGAPIFVNNERYGTLNFSSPNPRANPFSDNDIALIQLFAQWVGNEMARTSSEIQLSQFKTTLDKTQDCVFMFDPTSLSFFYVNQGAQDQVGYSYDELLTMTPVDIKPEISTEQFSRMIEPLISGEQTSLNFETVHEHKNGTRIPVDIFLQYIAPEDEPPRFVAIVRDITERKRIDNMKNEFVSTVSHELRTPLTSIRGSLGLVTGGAVGEIPDKALDLISIANNNTERLLLLINDILDLQKIKSGKLTFNFKNLDLQPFLEEALQENAGYAREHKVDFKLKCNHKDIVVFADHERLMQVMNNLLSNAAKFSPDDAPVDVDCQYEENHVRILVRDYGEGIPEEFHENLFDKFTQADSSDSRKLGGTGLGLSIAKLIVEKHGGHIGFESKYGQGTTFYFDIPTASAKN